MKTFVKSNGSLHSGNTATIKVYSSLPSDLSDINESEVIILENVGFYQKENNSLTPLFDESAVVASDGTIGDIIAYYGATNPDPTNYVVCNGSTFSSTDFPELYALLGTNTTPDLTGYHLKGVGNNHTWSSHDAISLKSKVAANYPNHTHTVNNPGHGHSINAGSHYHCYCANCNFSYFTQNVFNYTSSSSCPWNESFCCWCRADGTSPSSISRTVNAVNLGTVTIGCPSTASGYSAVRYGSETKCKDKTVLFLMRAK